jgi:hypothetical protein
MQVYFIQYIHTDTLYPYRFTLRSTFTLIHYTPTGSRVHGDFELVVNKDEDHDGLPDAAGRIKVGV